MTISIAEYATMDATALASAVSRRQISLTEVWETFSRAAVLGDQLNAWAERYSGPGKGQGFGPLVGVPLVRKDLGNPEAGRLKEYGSPLAKGLESSTESIFFQRLKANGAFTVGRSRVPELGLSVSCESAWAGFTSNPYDPERSPGGSSGGSAALVSAGVVPIAHGDDGAGSLRIPAACCGLFGLKPSRGRISNSPWAGEDLLGLDQAFLLTRSVRDCRLLMRVLGNPAPGDPFVPSVDGRAEGQVRSVGLITQRWGDSAPNVEHIQAVRACGMELEARGYSVQEVDFHFPFDAYCEIVFWVFSEATAALADSLSKATGRSVNHETVQPATLAWIEAGRRRSAWQVYETMEQINAFSRKLGQAFGAYDVLIAPSLAGRPPGPGAFLREPEDFTDLLALNRELEDFSQYAGAFNVTGQPAIAIPFGMHTDGLPLSVQVVGRHGAENLILELAEELYRPPKRPPIHVVNLA